jgi:3-deoxy-D-manno-octulosonate 8-phosphate phosphatase KdsC-like HAD superfamily phosphatase
LLPGLLIQAPVGSAGGPWNVAMVGDGVNDVPALKPCGWQLHRD